ncbi:MAG: HAMP domain-containing protein [Betaproteobacteria bacterium]|nr:HAMP domain-containing protein [Betaproteobacteria bacterium]
MKLKRTQGISTQLTLLACGILILAVTCLSMLAYFRASAALDRRWREDLSAQVRLLAHQFQTFDATAKANTDRLSQVFVNMLGGHVRVDPGRVVRIGQHEAPVVMSDSGVLNLDFSDVDAFTRMTGGNATVFVRTGDDFLRVTTSLKKQDGSRALGTLLGTGHPGYDALIHGRPYVGKAHLFGRDYMTKYSPVVDASGRTVAILYVGFDITEGLAALFDGVASSRVGENGYYFVLDASDGPSRGELVVRPEARSGAVPAAPSPAALAEVLKNGDDVFSRDGRLYVSYPFPAWHQIFGASVSDEELHADAVRVRNVLLLIGILVTVVGCVVTYLAVTRRLRPLAQLADDAERIGAGDLTVRSDVTTPDEIGDVARAFNHMAGQVQDIVVRLKRMVDGLGEAVTSVREESRQVRAGSESQSEAASRAAAALEEVTASLSQVSENARDSRRLSERTNDLSVEGESVAARAADETAAIAAAVRDSAERISALSVRSDQISEVVKVIKDIADQTNLLALNAAIEAARAGEQGRGFAVVADEVRKLAERTSQATIEIGEMISAIQAETGGAVTGMQEGSGRVEEGVRLVRQAATALNEIRAAAAETVAKAAEISHAMAEQSAAGTEISSNVENIAMMADRNSGAASRNEEVVAQIERLAAELTSLTAGLRVA